MQICTLYSSLKHITWTVTNMPADRIFKLCCLKCHIAENCVPWSFVRWRHNRWQLEHVMGTIILFFKEEWSNCKTDTEATLDSVFDWMQWTTLGISQLWIQEVGQEDTPSPLPNQSIEMSFSRFEILCLYMSKRANLFENFLLSPWSSKNPSQRKISEFNTGIFCAQTLRLCVYSQHLSEKCLICQQEIQWQALSTSIHEKNCNERASIWAG